jgi:hypothetical protein
MKRFLWVLAVWAVAGATGAQVGEKANLDVVQWYNTPPISAEQLQGHGVLVEVFRTW